MRRTPRPDPRGGSTARRPLAVTLAWILLPPIAGFAITYVVARRGPPETAAPASVAPPPAPERSFFDEVARLERELRLGEAIQKLDEFSPKLSPEPDAALRVEVLRGVLEKKARELQATRVGEARTLAAQGRSREAVDRLADVGRLGAASKLAPLVTEAYLELRRAAGESLAARRRASLEKAERDIALPRNDGGEPGSARALRRFEQGDFAGVLADARRSDRLDPGLLLLSLCATRAPLDGAVLRLYESVLEKSTDDRAAWVALGSLHTWRQDAPAAADVVRRAEERGPFELVRPVTPRAAGPVPTA